MNTGVNIGELKNWIGRSCTDSDTVTPVPIAAMRATLDMDAGLPDTGDPLPPMWQELYFLSLPRQSILDANGHEITGDFLPPVPLRRRMYAGKRMQFYHPLRVGENIRRTSTITDISLKHGKTGELVFVQVTHEIQNPQGLAILEQQDIVYRDINQEEKNIKSSRPAPAEHAWSETMTADSRLLFRYSALTFNTHRIHYDYPYVTGEEGYPGLLVHGPLLATLLLKLLDRYQPGVAVREFNFRAIAPLYAGMPFMLCGDPDPSTKKVRLWVQDNGGTLCMDAEALTETAG